MIRTQNPDGTWTERTDEEFVKEFGEEELRWIRQPLLKRSEMTEGQKYLADRQNFEGRLNAELEAAGIETLDDPPREPATRESLDDPHPEWDRD